MQNQIIMRLKERNLKKDFRQEIISVGEGMEKREHLCLLVRM